MVRDCVMFLLIKEVGLVLYHRVQQFAGAR